MVEEILQNPETECNIFPMTQDAEVRKMIERKVLELNSCGNVIHEIRHKNVEDLNLVDAFALHHMNQKILDICLKKDEAAAMGISEESRQGRCASMLRVGILCETLSDFIEHFLIKNKNLYDKNGRHKYCNAAHVILGYAIDDLVDSLAFLVLDEEEDETCLN